MAVTLCLGPCPFRDDGSKNTATSGCCSACVERLCSAIWWYAWFLIWSNMSDVITWCVQRILVGLPSVLLLKTHIETERDILSSTTRSYEKKSTKNFNHVWRGHIEGLFYKWSDCLESIREFPGPKFKGFHVLGQGSQLWPLWRGQVVFHVWLEPLSL